MSATIIFQAKDVSAWRGARGSGDMMAGTAALMISAKEEGRPFPDFFVEIVGTPEELRVLRVKLIGALEAESW